MKKYLEPEVEYVEFATEVITDNTTIIPSTGEEGEGNI